MVIERAVVSVEVMHAEFMGTKALQRAPNSHQCPVSFSWVKRVIEKSHAKLAELCYWCVIVSDARVSTAGIIVYYSVILLG